MTASEGLPVFYKLYEAVLASRPARLLDGRDRRGERIFIPGRPPSRTELPAPYQGAPFGLSVENLANWVPAPYHTVDGTGHPTCLNEPGCHSLALARLNYPGLAFPMAKYNYGETGLREVGA